MRRNTFWRKKNRNVCNGSSFLSCLKLCTCYSVSKRCSVAGVGNAMQATACGPGIITPVCRTDTPIRPSAYTAAPCTALPRCRQWSERGWVWPACSWNGKRPRAPHAPLATLHSIKLSFSHSDCPHWMSGTAVSVKVSDGADNLFRLMFLIQ